MNFLSCEKNTYFNKIEDITEQSDFKTGKQLNYFHKQPLLWSWHTLWLWIIMILENTVVLITIFICQYCPSTLLFSIISLPLSIFCHIKWNSSKSHAITFLSALILSSCSRDHACKFIYEDLINPTVYFNMHCSCKNPPQLKYASKHPNLSKQAAFLFARWLETAWNYIMGRRSGIRTEELLFIHTGSWFEGTGHVPVLMAHIF